MSRELELSLSAILLATIIPEVSLTVPRSGASVFPSKKPHNFKVFTVKKPTLGIGRLFLILFSVFVWSGCSIDADKIQGWERMPNGDKRLTGFLADESRPPDLRILAARVLIRQGNFGHITHVISSLSPERRPVLVNALAVHVHNVMEKDTFDQKTRMQMAGFAFYLFEYFEFIKGDNAGGSRATQFTEAVVGWSLDQLKNYEKLPKGPRKFSDILTAAAVANPAVTLPMIYNFMRAPRDAGRLLQVNAVLSALKDPEAKAKQASYLLDYAKSTYPNLSPELAEAMLQNRNETLLRFLLECLRDHRVPDATREKGILAAKVLKEKAVDGLLLVLQTDDPGHDNVPRLNALDMVWDFLGAKGLSRALQALPATGTWWPTGIDFKNQVDEFCQNKLAPAAEEVRPILTSLIDDPNWVTRTYAMECIIQLYPGDAPEILSSLADDDTALEGWVEGSVTSIGSVVAGLSAGDAQ